MESMAEEAALAWLVARCCAVPHGPETAAVMSGAELDDFGQVTLPQRLRGQLFTAAAISR